MKEAPEDIKAISKDVQTLSFILAAMTEVLNDVDFRSLVASDRTMISMIAALEFPLRQCNIVRSELRLKTHNLLKHGNTGFRNVALTTVKWRLSTGREISALQRGLEVAKPTLNSTWQLLTTYVAEFH